MTTRLNRKVKNLNIQAEIGLTDICYQFRILRNLRIDIKDRLEEYSQSIEIDIHVNTRS